MATHRLEYQIAWIAERFGINAVCVVFPTYITVTFRRKHDPHTSFTYNLAVASSWNLEKLELCDALAMQVASHKLTLEQGIERLRQIEERPPRYKWWAELICMVLCSGALAPLFFGGGVIETGVSLFCGLFAGFFLLLAERVVAFARLLEPITAIFCALVASIVAQTTWFGPVNARAIMLAGMVWSLPGLQINTAISDLATRMMVSGTSRLMFALLIIFELGFGMVLGTKLGYLVPAEMSSSELANAVVPTIPLSGWFSLLWIPIAAITLGILLGASPHQFPPIIVSSAVASCQTLLAKVLSTDIATMLAQTGVVLVGNLYARSFDRPAFIPTTIGSIMLMPSSLGVRGIASAILAQDASTAMLFGFNMLSTAVSMVVGGYIANAILYPKRAFN
jgi:uncharacterized membrane protein YjjP (DUF1212 family)